MHPECFSVFSVEFVSCGHVFNSCYMEMINCVVGEVEVSGYGRVLIV